MPEKFREQHEESSNEAKEGILEFSTSKEEAKKISNTEDGVKFQKDLEIRKAEKYQSKEDVLEAIAEREKLGLKNTSTVLRKSLREGGDETLLRFIQKWNRENPKDQIALPKDMGWMAGAPRKYQNKEDALKALAERKSIGLENTSSALRKKFSGGGDYSLVKFIWKYNNKHSEDPIELRSLRNLNRGKYRSKEDVLEAIAERERNGLENTYSAIKASKNFSALNFIYKWNKKNPENRIELPRGIQERYQKYISKEDALQALAERQKLGLKNTARDLAKGQIEGGDSTLLIFIQKWNREHSEDLIKIDKADREVSHVDPLIVWRKQTQEFGATEEQRTQLWRTLKRGNQNAGKELAESFIPIVNTIAQKISGGKSPDYEADLIQNGNLIVLEILNSKEEKDQWDATGTISLTDFIKKKLEEQMRPITTKQRFTREGMISLDERDNEGRLKYEAPAKKEPHSK